VTEEQRALLLSRLQSKLTSDGSVRVVASDMRSQSRNREIAEERLGEMVRRALAVRRKRKPTKPTRAAKEARLESKKRHSRKKDERRTRSFD
jgi:ribosome-associated protein